MIESQTDDWKEKKRNVTVTSIGLIPRVIYSIYWRAVGLEMLDQFFRIYPVIYLVRYH